MDIKQSISQILEYLHKVDRHEDDILEIKKRLITLESGGKPEPPNDFVKGHTPL